VLDWLLLLSPMALTLCERVLDVVVPPHAILHSSSRVHPASHPGLPCLGARWPWQPLQAEHLMRKGVQQMEAMAIARIARCTRDMEKSLALYRDM